jgi:hypothetical protein
MIRTIWGWSLVFFATSIVAAAPASHLDGETAGQDIKRPVDKDGQPMRLCEDVKNATFPYTYSDHNEPLNNSKKFGEIRFSVQPKNPDEAPNTLTFSLEATRPAGAREEEFNMIEEHTAAVASRSLLPGQEAGYIDEKMPFELTTNDGTPLVGSSRVFNEDGTTTFKPIKSGKAQITLTFPPDAKSSEWEMQFYVGRKMNDTDAQSYIESITHARLRVMMKVGRCYDKDARVTRVWITDKPAFTQANDLRRRVVARGVIAGLQAGLPARDATLLPKKGETPEAAKAVVDRRLKAAEEDVDTLVNELRRTGRTFRTKLASEVAKQRMDRLSAQEQELRRLFTSSAISDMDRRHIEARLREIEERKSVDVSKDGGSVKDYEIRLKYARMFSASPDIDTQEQRAYLADALSFQAMLKYAKENPDKR